MPILSGFSSVFEVSVGVHLAYGFFPDFHDYFENRKEIILKKVNALKALNESDEYKSYVESYIKLIETIRLGSKSKYPGPEGQALGYP